MSQTDKEILLTEHEQRLIRKLLRDGIDKAGDEMKNFNSSSIHWGSVGFGYKQHQKQLISLHDKFERARGKVK